MFLYIFNDLYIYILKINNISIGYYFNYDLARDFLYSCYYANFIKDTFVKDYSLREMALIPIKNSAVDTDMSPGEVKFESVDQIVTDQLTNIESEFYDPKLLLKIYQNL